MLVIPGSSNVIGGQGVWLKPRLTQSAQEMVVAKTPHVMKMAIGENPIRTYGPHQTPATVMGTFSGLRAMFFQAAQLKDRQDAWYCLKEAKRAFEPLPRDLTLEPLVGILRGEVQVMIHCYQVHEFESMVRLADEFNFTITAFHHALGWKHSLIDCSCRLTLRIVENTEILQRSEYRHRHIRR
jgi:hypothetical protein